MEDLRSSLRTSLAFAPMRLLKVEAGLQTRSGAYVSVDAILEAIRDGRPLQEEDFELNRPWGRTEAVPEELIEISGISLLDEIAKRTHFDLRNESFASLEQWDVVPERFKVRSDAKGKFFLYQPSGGWGNQKLILKWAIIAANAMNRTLVLPPVAPHSSFYQGFNKFKKESLLHMGQVLDLDILETRVYTGILVHDGDMVSYQNEILQHLKWRLYEKPGAVSFIQERAIMKRWATEPADVVFWHKTTMWRCCATSQQRYFSFIDDGMVFSRHLQSVALRGIERIGARYNAIHFRRGDSHLKERKSVDRYVKVHRFGVQKMNGSFPLYIATDEMDKDFFKPFVEKFGFKDLVFLDSLNSSLLDEFFAKKVPPDMKSDVMGFIDQIACIYAERWTGSEKSTFSYVVSAMRNNRQQNGIYYVKSKQVEGQAVKFLPRRLTDLLSDPFT